MALLQPKVPFWVFPCACWNPYFYSVLSLGMATKKDHFPKTDSCKQRKCAFFTVWTQIVFAYFSKKWHFYKKTILLHNHPKTLFFCFFLKCFFFHFFHIVLFTFSNIQKRQKQKVHMFFSKTHFLTPWQTAQNFIFAPLHTICVFLDQQKTL